MLNGESMEHYVARDDTSLDVVRADVYSRLVIRQCECVFGAAGYGITHS